MNTHHLASYLRQNRRPAQPHLRGFKDSLMSAGKSAGTAFIDSAQESAGDYAEETLTDLTGNEDIGKAGRAALDAGVDEAQGQTPQQPPQQTIDPNTLRALRSVAPLIAQRRIAPIDYGRLRTISSGLATLPVTQLPANTANQQLILDPEPESPEPTTESAEGDGKKKALIIGGSVLALVLIGGGVYFATRKK